MGTNKIGRLTWADLIIDFSHLNPKSIIEEWTWLIGHKMVPVMISCIGDLFLSDINGNIHWLNVGDGTLTKAADDIDELKDKMNNPELANEWFMLELVREIKESGLILTPGKLYGYKKLPIIGGAYKATNFELVDIEIHFSLAGQIHEQIKDLPDGTKVKIKPE